MEKKALIRILAWASAAVVGMAYGFSAGTRAPGAAMAPPVLPDVVAGVLGSGNPDILGGEVFKAIRKSGGAAGRAQVAGQTEEALGVLGRRVRIMSHPRALREAFGGYYAYKAARPGDVRKPYLYFVDYGLPNTMARGYVFNMENLSVVDGPFMVAHGRGSVANHLGVPKFFSNRFGAATTSLGLYVAQELYNFTGSAGGRRYRSVGLRLAGVSGDYNSNARARGVVAHGAPYVTHNKAGRSEGCPAVDQARAQYILPKLANGGIVFLFAPDPNWLDKDPWAQVAVGE